MIWIKDFNIKSPSSTDNIIAADIPSDLQEYRALDVDGDGSVDVLTRQSPLSGTWQLHLNAGGGSFLPPQDTGLDGSYDTFWDRDGDGDLDGLQVDPVTGRLRGAENLDGVFQSPAALLDADAQPILNDDFGEFLFADLTADGRGDIVAAGKSDQVGAIDIFWFEQQADGTFDSEVIFIHPRPADFSFTVDLQLDDIDADGDLDIVASNRQVSEIPLIQRTLTSVDWYENNSAGFTTTGSDC